MTARRRPVLVVGLPRSGTTWTESVLGTAVGATVVTEPDNEKLSAPAIWAKRRLGRFPVLAPGDEAGSYRRLWRWVFDGAPGNRSNLRAARRLLERSGPDDLEALARGRPSPRLRIAGALGSRLESVEPSELVVAKSVHVCLAVDWIADEFDVDVLVVLRHPANVLSSWLELNLPDRDRGLGESPLIRQRFVERWGVPLPGPGAIERVAWQLGLFTAALEQSASGHPGWVVRTHERLCSNPESEFRKLFGDLGLTWGPTTSLMLEQSDTPGTGFSLKRRSSDLAESWKSRLGDEELETLGRVLEHFPIKTWNPADLTTMRKRSE